LANKNVISLDKIKVACRDCSLSTLCLPMGLRPEDVDRLDAIVKRSRPLQRGDHLFRTGEHFRNLYVVKTGAVKTFTQTNDGDEQVVGFHLPGEVLGLDAIQDGSHGCSARALETTAICELPFDRLADLSANIPSLQHQMFRLLSREIGQWIDLDGGRIRVVVVDVRGDKVRLGFEADRDVTIHRREIQRAIEREESNNG